MKVEISQSIGAERGEQAEDRATHRNGYRPRRWDTRAGEIELQIPQIRRGSLPWAPAASQAIRAGAGLSDPAGLRVRGLDAAGRSARRVARAADQQVGDLADRAGRLDEQVQPFRE